MATYCPSCGCGNFVESTGACPTCGAQAGCATADMVCPDVWALLDQDVPARRDDDEYRRCRGNARRHAAVLRDRRTINTPR